MASTDKSNSASNAAGNVAKIVFLSLFALALVVVSVSFAIHHMRIGFEKEYDRILINRIQVDAQNAALAVSGDEIVNDPAAAAVKYKAILPYMLMDANEKDYSVQAFGLYNYLNGSLSVLTGNDSDLLVATKIPVSDWLTAEMKPYEIKDEYLYHYLIPISDSQGNACALLELSAKSAEIETLGNKLESVILSTVILAVLIAMAIFSLQYIIPPVITLISNKNNAEAKL
ncbi:MAG: hypothetical protein IKD90_03405 [Clostridiales bacterium]|nr:hypothetical protein [Clostridiales bacterium]